MLPMLGGFVFMASNAHGQRTDEGFRVKDPSGTERGTAGSSESLQPDRMLEKYGASDGTTPNSPKVVPPPVSAPIVTPTPAIVEEKDMRPAFLGVHYEISRTDILGSYVTEVEPNTPASAVGLHQGDVILKADGQPLDQLEDLVRIISAKHVGDKVALTVNRAGTVFTVAPKLAERTRDLITYQYNSVDGFAMPNGSTLWIEDGMSKSRPFLGVTFRREERILSIDGEKVVKAPISKDLVVADVAEGSTAKLMGILPGDVITALNGKALADFDALTAMLQNMAVGQEIRLTYLRGGRPLNSVGRLRANPGNNPGMGFRPPTKPGVGGGPNPNEEFTMDRMLERMKEMAVEARANNRSLVTIAEAPVSTQEVSEIRTKSGVDFPASSALAVQEFKITPYGANGTYAVQFSLTTRGNTLIYVLDSEGSIAYSENLPSFSGGYRKTFTLPDSELGSYFVQITQAGRSFTRKITLQ